MLVCDWCGRVVDSVNCWEDKDFVDNGLGLECVRSDTICEDCSCGGTFTEATNCLLCGDFFYDKHYREICDDCLEEEATFENALKMGDEEDCKEEIKINGYLASEYDSCQIESLLLKDLKEAKSAGCCLNYRDFCLNDKDYFADWLKKENY